MKPWFKVVGLVDNKAKMEIYEEVGYDWWDDSGVSARAFQATIDAFGDVSEIALRISSPGGSVRDGLAIYNILKNHPAHVTTYNDGMCNSIASVIFLAGDTRVMPSNATMFVHKASSGIAGNADDMKMMAQHLEAVDVGIAMVYVENSNLDLEAAQELLTNQTSLTAAQCEEYGFIDAVTDPVQAVANFDTEAVAQRADEQFKAYVATIKAKAKTKTPPTDPENKVVAATTEEIINLCEEAGFKNLSVDLIQAKLSVEAVNKHLASCKAVNEAFNIAEIPVEDTLDHINDVGALVRSTITNVLAHAEPNGDNKFNNPKDTSSSKREPNRKDIFTARKAQNKRF